MEILRERDAQKRTAGSEEPVGGKRARMGGPYGGTGIDASHAAASSGLDPAKMERMRADIAGAFPARLQQLLECDRSPLRGQEARFMWDLPVEHRLMAGLFDLTWKTCKRLGIPVTAATMDTLLQQALQAVAALAQAGIGPVADLLKDPDLSHLQALLAAPHKFAPRAAETAQIFAQVVRDIEQQSGHVIAADEMWRLCIDPQIVAMLEERGIDSTNPMLGYLFDSQTGYLHGMACLWLFTMQWIKSGKALDAQFLIALTPVFTGRDGGNADDVDDEVDAAASALAATGLETEDVEFGMLCGANRSEGGEAVLRGDTAAGLEPFGIKLCVGEGRWDAVLSAQFGRPFRTLVREAAEPAQLLAALEHWFKEYKKECNAPGADLALADVRLARRINQTHAFVDGNVRRCHLLKNGLALKRRERPFMFADPNWLDCRADAELQQAYAQAQAGIVPLPMSGIEERDETAYGEFGAAEPLPDGRRLPRRNARVEGDFPWPLIARLRLRLSENRTLNVVELRDIADRTVHGGKLIPFARRVIQAKFEAPEPGLPDAAHRYVASLPGLKGEPVEVALLAYVEDGHITDIQTDTPANRVESAFPWPLTETLRKRLGQYTIGATKELRDFADRTVHGNKGTAFFARQVIQAKFEAPVSGLPDGVRRYVASLPGLNGESVKVALLAYVEDGHITDIRTDTPANRVEGDFPWPLAARLQERLCEIKPKTTKALRDIAARTVHGNKGMPFFVRQVIQEKFEAPVSGLPDRVRRYVASLPGLDGSEPVEVALLVYVEEGHITDIRTDTEDNRLEADFPWPLTAALRVRLCSVSGRVSTTTELRKIAARTTHSGGMVPFAKRVIQAKFEAPESGLPDAAHRYVASLDGLKGEPVEVALLAYVEDGHITDIRSDTPANRVEGDFPLPLTEALWVRLRRNNISTVELREIARLTVHGDKGAAFFARQVIQAKFESPEPGLPDAAHRYVASLDGLKGEPVEVALLAYVEGGHITDIRTDVPANRVEGDSPWPLTKPLRERLNSNQRINATKELRDIAELTVHGDKGMPFFVQQVIQEKFEAPVSGLPDGARRYVASLPRLNGSKPVDVALLVYVEEGHITDIRTDTEDNRKKISMAKNRCMEKSISDRAAPELPQNLTQEKSKPRRSSKIAKVLLNALSARDEKPWVTDLWAAALDAEYSSGTTDLGDAALDVKYSSGTKVDFVCDVVKSGAGRNDDNDPLPANVRLYDYRPSKDSTKVVTLVALVLNDVIRAVRLDTPQGRDEIKKLSTRGARKTA